MNCSDLQEEILLVFHHTNCSAFRSKIFYNVDYDLLCISESFFFALPKLIFCLFP